MKNTCQSRDSILLDEILLREYLEYRYPDNLLGQYMLMLPQAHPLHQAYYTNQKIPAPIRASPFYFQPGYSREPDLPPLGLAPTDAKYMDGHKNNHSEHRSQIH